MTFSRKKENTDVIGRQTIQVLRRGIKRVKDIGSEEATFIPSTPIRVRSSSGNFYLSRDSVGTILGSQGQYAKATQRNELIAISSIHFLNSLC